MSMIPKVMICNFFLFFGALATRIWLSYQKTDPEEDEDKEKIAVFAALGNTMEMFIIYSSINIASLGTLSLLCRRWEIFADFVTIAAMLGPAGL